MPKYYCTNDDFKIILDAPNKEAAMQKLLYNMIECEHGCALISTISEKGFSSDKALLISMIPFLKNEGIELPNDDELLIHACKYIGLSPDKISEKTKNWLLNGDDDGFIKS